MKKTVLLLLTFFSFSIHSQIPKEAFTLTNSLSDLWKKDNPKEAIKASKKLNKIFQPFFIENIHNSLAQTIHRNNGNGHESFFLNQLYNQKQVSINKIIEPIYLWNKSLKINKQTEADSLLKKYYKKIPNSTNYKSKTELYAFLIIKGFDKKKLGSTKLKNKILTKISFNISSNQLINSTKEKSKEISEERAHYRFLLAYNYNNLFNINKTEKLIKNASKYSPDKSDLKNMSGFFYDAHILINGPHNINYKKKYFTYLIKNGKGEHAESILLERAYIQPTDENLKDLKYFYSIKTANKPFEIIWNNYLNSKMKKVPELNLKFQFETLNLIKKRNHWIYIDIWGTWCKPCIKELPKFNVLAKKYNETSGSKIKFYTLSYNSENLENFMTKNNYTFPVLEINDKITKLFKVNSYPTKILISPNNKYLKIPYGINWVEYVKNYALIK